MAKLCMDMLANDQGFRQLIALAETEGPDALRIRTGYWQSLLTATSAAAASAHPANMIKGLRQ